MFYVKQIPKLISHGCLISLQINPDVSFVSVVIIKDAVKEDERQEDV